MKKVYIVAAVLSIFFYLIGLFSGLFIERSIFSYTEDKIGILQKEIRQSDEIYSSLNRRLLSLQLEHAYLSIIGKDLQCSSLSTLVQDTTKKVWELGKELNEKNPKFDELRRDYALLSIRAWILNNYVKEKCRNNVTIILYFYSVPCEDCIKQGEILDKLREEKFKDKILIFVLNSDLDEPIVNTLKTAYSIKKTPSLVIGEKTYSNLISEENLTKIISGELG
ncbi:MAG: hypothetical protein QXY62_04715 [Candidatus Altiarchaeota archaeon]